MKTDIAQLAEAAGGTRKYVPAVWQFYDSELQKFAELIVRECNRAVLEVPCYYKDYRAQIEEAVIHDCARAVLEHFEVQ